MCTLIVAWRVFEAAPVCVAANRDEALDRPSVPPTVRAPADGPRVLAPRDERAGGTWLGYNEHGVLAAVTNRWTAGQGERSRGLLVDDALAASTAAAAVERVREALESRSYAPFHLLVADAEDCLVVANGGEGATADADTPVVVAPDAHAVTPLEPGLHVIGNVGWDGAWFVPEGRPEAGRRQARNLEAVRAVLSPRTDESANDWLGRAADVLGDHEYGVCVHGDGFGTRSSSLVRLGREPAYLFADGPPCETPYEPADDMI